MFWKRAWSGGAAATSGLLLLALVCAGCGCSGKIDSIKQTVANATQPAKPLDGKEPALLLMYLDDSASMDPYRSKYAQWAIDLLQGIKPDNPAKVGVRLCTFRSEVTDKADLQLTGKAELDNAILDYEKAHTADPDDEKPKADTRDQGTSMKEAMRDAMAQIGRSDASNVLIAILCDGGIEDGKNGDLKGALAAARQLEKLPRGKSVRVLMLGLSEDDNGALIRGQEAFWAKVKVPSRLGKRADTDDIIKTEAPEFAAKAK